ncbi:MAG TPA: hypothetical protein VMV48_00875 [Gallionellaceae bacterium]|nr:hypothetical protein [Gallionellaceae bacterium]
MNFNALRHTARILMSLSLLFALTACSSNAPFKKFDANKKIKPSTIAVISGGDDDLDIKLAELISNDLSRRSTFTVMPQSEIAKKIHEYPATIRLVYKLADEQKPVWFGLSEFEKVNAIQDRLKVDYLFVVWNRDFFQGYTAFSTYDYVVPAGNLIEYPGAKVVASSMLYSHSRVGLLKWFRDADYYLVDALENGAEDIVNEFLDVTNSKK